MSFPCETMPRTKSVPCIQGRRRRLFNRQSPPPKAGYSGKSFLPLSDPGDCVDCSSVCESACTEQLALPKFFLCDHYELKSLFKLAAICAIGLIAAAFAFLIYKIYPATSEEPFYWLEGVSIWPTEIIRGIAFLLAICFTWYGWKSLNDSENTLAGTFFPPRATKPPDNNNTPDQTTAQSAEQDGEDDLLSRAWKEFKKILLVELGPDGKSHPRSHNTSDIWQSYREQSHSKIVRFAWCWAEHFYLALAVLFITYFGAPSTLARGEITVSIDKLVLGLLIPAFILLLFFVIDSIRLCKLMADHLSPAKRSGKTARGPKRLKTGI